MASTHLHLAKRQSVDLLARYVVSLLDGYSIKKLRVSTKTIKCYLRAINNYYVANNARSPYIETEDSPAQRILLGQKRFEDIPERREPLHDFVLTRMCDLAQSSSPLGFAAAVWDITALGRFAGFRQQEYAMDSRTAPKYYVKPDGSRVLRAFAVKNFLFRDALGVLIDQPLSRRADILQAGIRYDIQKNGMNGQVIWYHKESRYPELCPVRIARPEFGRSSLRVSAAK